MIQVSQDAALSICHQLRTLPLQPLALCSQRLRGASTLTPLGCSLYDLHTANPLEDPEVSLQPSFSILFLNILALCLVSLPTEVLQLQKDEDVSEGKRSGRRQRTSILLLN